MLAARQLEIVENCHKPSYQPRKNSGHISSEIVNKLAAFAIPLYHPEGAALFAEGQPSRGVFILYSGRVKLFTSSADGKILILGFADPGEILGLAGTLSGQPYEAWAEAIQPAQTSFVERRYLVHLMRRHRDLAVQVAMHLGDTYCSAIAGVRILGHSRSANQKLAAFLLGCCEINSPFYDRVGARLTLTHEEISQMIGTSRETVTRLLSGFRKKGLIQWKGCNLILTDRAALESSAANHHAPVADPRVPTRDGYESSDL
jgi:CRP/FNR family transcriptional regulator, cyclic AMP receptor protein